VQHTTGQGEDYNKKYGGINGGTITSRKGKPSNVVRSDGGAYHYIDRKDQRDVTYTRASDIMPHMVAGANKVITSTTHTTTREVNLSQQHIDDLIHRGGDGAENLPRDECLSPRSRAVMEHGQTIESAIRPNHDNREHNTPLSPRGVRVVQPTAGGGHEFGGSSTSLRHANGQFGSNVVRTDGGAYKYVDREDDHAYYMEMLGGVPAVTGQTSYPAHEAQSSHMPHDIAAPGSPSGRNRPAATYCPGYIPAHEQERLAQLNAPPKPQHLGVVDRLGQPVQRQAGQPSTGDATEDLLRGGFESDTIAWDTAGDIDAALSPNSQANLANVRQQQLVAEQNLVHESQWNGLTSPKHSSGWSGGSDLQQTEYHKWLAAGGGKSPRSVSASPITKSVRKLDVQMKAGDFKSPAPAPQPPRQVFDFEAAQRAQAAGKPLSPRSGSFLRVKQQYDSGAELSPRSQKIVEDTQGFTRFDTLRDMNWGNDFHTNRQISYTTFRDYKPHMQTFNLAAAQQAQAAGVPVSPRSGNVLRVKEIYDSGRPIQALSPRSRQIVQVTENFTNFENLPETNMNWGSDTHSADRVQNYR
jgi:hypothetical protein